MSLLRLLEVEFMELLLYVEKKVQMKVLLLKKYLSFLIVLVILEEF